MDGSNGLVRGVPAYTWSLAFVLAGAMTVLGLVSLVGALLSVATTGQPDLSVTVAPVVVLALGLTGLPLCRIALPRVAAREAEAGYTTVPLLSGDLPLRDPRDGRTLLAAGATVPRSYRVSLRPARRLAHA